MGNEQSQLLAVELDEKATEVGEFWSHYSAITNSDSTRVVSVFIDEPLVDGSLWVSQTPLEKAAKNLMIFRHPCILKYLSSWNKNSRFYLVVEHVIPLSHVLQTQNAVQICIGLYSILKALCFLHENAKVSHNNVCLASVYVTKDGDWKLGGLEYCCKYGNLTLDFLRKIKRYRCDKAVDPNEEKHFQGKDPEKTAIDTFAFGKLAAEVLANKTDEDIPSVTLFRDLCKNDLQNIDVTKRPTLSSLLKHPFFNNDFVIIYSSLLELPLKSDEEKKTFFSTLLEKLKKFDETVIAIQLGGLLLSRLVLLNATAQTYLLPFILCPREGDKKTNGLFSTATFRKYIVPRLLQIYCVRDTQVRLLLLEHFSDYVCCFSKEELQYQVLPELLLGIKDTNNHLVSITLRALADLVQILGAEIVIGGKRAKLFNDGRPNLYHVKPTRRKSENILPTPDTSDVISNSSGNNSRSNSRSETDMNLVNELPERSRPDGEENELSNEDPEQSAEEEIDGWDDWDLNESNLHEDVSSNYSQMETNRSEVQLNMSNLKIQDGWENNSSQGTASEKTSSGKRGPAKPLPNIFELDIKNQVMNSELDTMNFFEDMEPVINTSNKFLVTEINSASNDLNIDNVEVHQRLNLDIKDSNAVIEGWGDDEWD